MAGHTGQFPSTNPRGSDELGEVLLLEFSQVLAVHLIDDIDSVLQPIQYARVIPSTVSAHQAA